MSGNQYMLSTFHPTILRPYCSFAMIGEVLMNKKRDRRHVKGNGRTSKQKTAISNTSKLKTRE